MRLFAAALLATLPDLAVAQPMPGQEVIEPGSKQLAQLQALTPQGVKAEVSISDDELEPIATLSTSKAWSSRGRFMDKVRSDNFLRAFITKRTGKVSYQLYQEITYTGDWRNFRTVNFTTSAGLASAEVDSIDHEVMTCGYGLCVHRDTVGFSLPPSVIEEIASQYSAGNSPLWRFRFKGRGFDWEDRIAPAEAAGLLLAVKEYQERSRSEGMLQE